MDEDFRCKRVEMLSLRLTKRGLSETVRDALSAELLHLHDLEPGAANAHVLAWRSALRLLVIGEVPATVAPQRVAKALPRILASRKVDNPLTTDAQREYEHQTKAKAPGQVEVEANLLLIVGGLARIEGYSELQFKAAAKYRSLFDGAQLGGARATDYQQLRVDVSGAPGVDLEVRHQDVRAEYSQASQMLGINRSSLVEAVVCYDRSMRDIARSLWQGDGGAAQSRTRQMFLVAIDALVDHFGFDRKPSGRMRGEGERARWGTMPIAS